MEKRVVIKLVSVLAIALALTLVQHKTAIGSPCYAQTNLVCKQKGSSCTDPLCYSGGGGLKCDLCGKCTGWGKVSQTSTRVVSVCAAPGQPGKTQTQPGDPCPYQCESKCSNCGGHPVTLTMYGDKNSTFSGNDCVGQEQPE